MNRQDFNQSGGFPFQTETLDEMQKATELFNKFGDLAGNFAIISGCVVTGSVVSNGSVFINGELLEFRGGLIGTDVIIVEEITAKEFEDGNDKNVLFVRYATFGIGITSFPWISFQRPKTTIQLTEDKAEQSLIETLIDRIETLEARPTANVPIGMIAIWGQDVSLIPVGWIEHTPLRGKMPIGLDPDYVQGADVINFNLNTLNSAGGTRQHKIVASELPANLNTSKPYQTGATTNDYLSPNTSNVAMPVMNPYRVVHFIKYVG